MTNYAKHLPLTSDRLGNYDRVKVDVGQTGFFEGREFRSFKELNIAAATTYVLRAVVPNDVILTSIDVGIESGILRIATILGGTPGGVFSETLPIFNRNNMSVGPNRRQVFVPEVVITAGGTHTGGTELDVIRVRTAINQGVSSSQSVGASVGDERGIGAGTYYFRLEASAGDPVVGILRMSWEERMAPS